MQFPKNKTKAFWVGEGRVVILEYSLFAVLIVAVVVVTLTGMDTDLDTLYVEAKTRLSVPSSGVIPKLPVATPAVNNATAMPEIPYDMILKEAGNSDPNRPGRDDH